MIVAIVIPAYNPGEALEEVVRRSIGQVGPQNVIVVNDGSTDGSCTPERLHGACCLAHATNLGKGEALKTGFREAIARGVDALVTVDADGQHDPALVRCLIEEAERTGADVVLGSRMANVGSMPRLRRLTNRTTSLLVSRLAGQRIEDSQCGFRLIRTRALIHLRLKSSRYDLESEMLIEAGQRGYRIVSVPIPSVYGDETSKIRPLADTARFIRLFFRSLRNRKNGIPEGDAWQTARSS